MGHEAPLSDQSIRNRERRSDRSSDELRNRVRAELTLIEALCTLGSELGCNPADPDRAEGPLAALLKCTSRAQEAVQEVVSFAVQDLEELEVAEIEERALVREVATERRPLRVARELVGLCASATPEEQEEIAQVLREKFGKNGESAEQVQPVSAG